MSDLSAQIGEILSNPEAMEQIRNLSGLFSQPAAPSAAPAPNPEISAQAPSFSKQPENSAAEALPAVMKFMPLIGSLQAEDDSTRLLRAVKPFLSPERQARIEQAIKLIRIIKIIPLLKEKGLLDFL